MAARVLGAPIAAAAIFGFSGWLVICFEIALLFETLVAVAVVVARYRTPVVGRTMSHHPDPDFVCHGFADSAHQGQLLL